MKEEEQDAIDRYLQQQFSEEEQQQFEAAMKADKALAAEVKLQQEVQQFLGDEQALKLENLLQEIGEEEAKNYQASNAQDATTITSNPPIRTLESSKSRWILIVAAASLILISTLVWWWQPTSASAADLYANYYETYPSDALDRANTSTSTNAYQLGIKSFLAADYATAQIQLEQALEAAESPENPHAAILFHLAMSQIEQENLAAAQQHLKQLLSTPTANLYEQAAHWYLALLYLKADDKKQSKLALKQVLALGVNGKYAQQAQLLLADL